MDEYVKKSDVKKVIILLKAGAKKSARMHPEDALIQSLSESELITLNLAWKLIDAQKTYKLEKT